MSRAHCGAIVALCLVVITAEAQLGRPRFFFEGGEAPAGGDAVGPLFGFEQDGDLAAWTGLDAQAVIDRCMDAGAAYEGEGCLRVTYQPRDAAFEQFSAQPLTVATAAGLSFAIRTDLPTNLSFGVVERGGAFYQQFAAIPADEWTVVSLPLSALVLAQDSQDLTPGLQPDSIVEIRMADLANLPGALGDALGRKVGVHQLFLDNVTFSAEAPVSAAGAGDPRLFVDGFEADTVHALAIGEALLSRVPDGEGHALQVLAEERGARWKGFVVAIGQLDLRPAQALSLRLRAADELILNVTLEERDGSKYSQRLGLEAGEAWIGREIPVDALVLETDSDDENGRLDRDQLRVLVINADMARAARFPASFQVDDLQFR
jgi:hypothetical protein